MQTKKTLTCATIKWGSAYAVEDVNRLYRAVLRNTKRKLRFICMTEVQEGLDAGIEWLPLTPPPFEANMLDCQKNAVHKGGALRKIALFNPDIYGGEPGPVLVLDIDILVTGPLDDLVDFAPGTVAMRKPFNSNPNPFSLGHGSVIKFEPAKHCFLYDTMATDTEASVARAEGSEQSYTSLTASDHGLLANLPEMWVVSFKYDCRPRRPLNIFLPPKLPDGARVICFHGKPNINQALVGYRHNIIGMSRPAPWIANYWA